MKYLVLAAVAATTISTTQVHAGGLSSPWDEPELTPVLCPLYGFLGLRWRWCPSVWSQSVDRDDKTDANSVTSTDRTSTDGKSKRDRLKGNNGWGNGDQDAPGNSGPNNSAENEEV